MKITANRADEEPFRIERLERIRDVLEAKSVSNLVSAIHDHKGTLYVNWTQHPSTSQLLVATDAWAAEREPLSNHYVNGMPLLWDVGGYNPFGEHGT